MAKTSVEVSMTLERCVPPLEEDKRGCFFLRGGSVAFGAPLAALREVAGAFVEAAGAKFNVR